MAKGKDGSLQEKEISFHPQYCSLLPDLQKPFQKSFTFGAQKTPPSDVVRATPAGSSSFSHSNQLLGSSDRSGNMQLMHSLNMQWLSWCSGSFSCEVITSGNFCDKLLRSVMNAEQWGGECFVVSRKFGLEEISPLIPAPRAPRSVCSTFNRYFREDLNPFNASEAKLFNYSSIASVPGNSFCLTFPMEIFG